jgi:two-component system phosphate regulon sensor histidine kinase PhoR
MLSGSLLAGWLTGMVLGTLGAGFAARSMAAPLAELSRSAEHLRRTGFRSAPQSGAFEESYAVTQALSEAGEALNRSRAQEESSRAELGSLLSAMAEGVLALDSQERVLMMNASATRMLGLREPLAVGSQWWVNLRFPELEQALRKVLAGQEAAPFDARAPMGDGSLLSLAINPLRTDGAIGGAVIVFSDVTAMRRLEQMRIDFVANVSHELRTPLSIVLGSLETVGDGGTDEESRKRFLEIAERNARRLHAIVTDLLDLSTIESQGAAMPMEQLELERTVRSSAEALRAAAQAKRVRLTLDDSLRTASHTVLGNAQRLDQVFTNLIENAIKYTPAEGEVRVLAMQQNGQVVVEVRDSGIGIPREHLHRIFERFYRVDRSRSRDMGGTGLGLSIVKHVVKAHGGQVEADSVEGQGSTFRVELPIHSQHT